MTAENTAVSGQTPQEQEAVFELADTLFDAAREGNTEYLAAYIDAGAPVDLKNATGDSLLMLAAYYAQAETVRVLLERGADPNLINDRQQSPLAGTVFKGEESIMEMLLGAGADPLLGSPNAVETAQFFGKEDLAERLGSSKN